MLAVITPTELKAVINDVYFRLCIQHDTPRGIINVLAEIETIRKEYVIQEEYELCAVCRDLAKELATENTVRVSNDLGDLLISLIR